MNSSKISVILPNYNYARYLPQRIESILNQSYANFELIILDDASTDNSIEVIESFKQQDNRIITIYNKENSGNPFVQWGKGIELAKGEYIWVAEADDYCENDLLEKLLAILDNDKNVAIAYCQSKIVNGYSKFQQLWTDKYQEKDKAKFSQDFISNGHGFIENYLIYQNVIPNASAILFRKEAYEKVGGVDTSGINCADWLLWIKMLYNNEVAHIADPLNYFRRHGASVIHQSGKELAKQKKFHEFYSLTMRLELSKWLKKNKKNKKIFQANNQYISLDLANKMVWAKKQRRFYIAIKLMIKAMACSNNNLSVLKRFLTS